jgi:hypothetical protein
MVPYLFTYIRHCSIPTGYVLSGVMSSPYGVVAGEYGLQKECTAGKHHKTKEKRA